MLAAKAAHTPHQWNASASSKGAPHLQSPLSPNSTRPTPTEEESCRGGSPVVEALVLSLAVDRLCQRGRDGLDHLLRQRLAAPRVLPGDQVAVPAGEADRAAGGAAFSAGRRAQGALPAQQSGGQQC